MRVYVKQRLEKNPRQVTEPPQHAAMSAEVALMTRRDEGVARARPWFGSFGTSVIEQSVEHGPGVVGPDGQVSLSFEKVG